ncbi:DMT family transporter [Celeribacter sp.]|uniref:DMT family transporter n=1 Tax=Celeribacter sp. TaxID=1890673 RepID=UPI003A948D6A
MTLASSPDTLASGNMRGAALMVAAMVLFALEDTLLKDVATRLPVGEVMMIFGIGGMAVFAGLIKQRNERLLHPALWSRVMLIRTLFEIMGRVFFTLSLVYTTLSSTSAILQATPIVVTAAGAIIWRAPVGALRWMLIILGFVGVLMVLQPTSGAFSPLSILAVLGMLGFAGRDLATRAAPPVLSYAQLGLYGFAALVLSGAGLLIWDGPATLPSALDLAALSGAILVGVSAYTCLTFAMRMGELSVVTPFRYSRLLFGMAMGILAFGERPDTWEIIGGVVIVIAGLSIMLTSSKRKTPAN